MKRLAMLACLIAVCDACAQAPEPPRFSTAQPGAVPSGWQTVLLSASKQPTEYALVADEGVVVLRANARSWPGAPISIHGPFRCFRGAGKRGQLPAPIRVRAVARTRRRA